MRPKRVVALLGTVFLAVVATVLVVQSKVLLITGEDVFVPSGDVVLTATLAKPRWGDGPFPAVVIVHGSGRIARRDLRLPSRLTEEKVGRLIESGHAGHTIKIYPNANHDFHDPGSNRLTDPLPDIRTWLRGIRVLSTRGNTR